MSLAGSHKDHTSGSVLNLIAFKSMRRDGQYSDFVS